MSARKEPKGRALRKGEIYRESDGRYAYGYVDPYGKRKFIYSKDLKKIKGKRRKTLQGSVRWLKCICDGKSLLKFCF